MMVRGDFRVETLVLAVKVGNPDAPPDDQLDSASGTEVPGQLYTPMTSSVVGPFGPDGAAIRG